MLEDLLAVSLKIQVIPPQTCSFLENQPPSPAHDLKPRAIANETWVNQTSLTIWILSQCGVLAWKWDCVELGKPFVFFFFFKFFYLISTAVEKARQQWEAGKESKDCIWFWPERREGILNFPFPVSLLGLPANLVRHLYITWIRNASASA